ncbi:MAG: hypothetical protein ACI9J2_000987 [Saprospiraceae bacterium]|jgi:hypothetical protein
MNIKELIQQINTAPDQVQFSDVTSLIAELYDYTPVRFSNGLGDDKVINEAGTNEGSCRIFAFGLDQALTEQQTLVCFGDYYRSDVLDNPQGSDHANIRTFMRHGWQGIAFDALALQRNRDLIRFAQ